MPLILTPKMMRTRFFVLLVTLSLHHVKVLADDDANPHCVRLTSAFNYEGDVYLVSGNDFFHINSDFEEIEHGTLEDEFYAPEGDIDAALEYDGDLYFFQDFDYYSYNYMYYFGSSGAATDNTEWGEFFEFGLDAATTLGNTSYFFHRCEYVKGYGNPEIMSIEDLGLPCHVDAAWGQNGKIYITLEDEFWVMDENEQVTGPDRLSELVNLTSTSMCQDDPFTARIRAEERYEREHQCTIIDAAVSYDDTVYLFNDYDYITLNDEGDEVNIGHVMEWGNLPENIDAGILWEGDGYTYFFQSDHYYKYYYITYFAMSNSAWDSFFLQGVDAAGTHNGMSYFFKDCDMVLYRDVGDLDIFHSPDFNLPCNPDAAFSRGGTLYVIKRNQVWTWWTDEEQADGPAPLSTAVTMTSWTACPPEEEEEDVK